MYSHHSKTNHSSSYRLFYKVRLTQNGTLNRPTVKKLCIYELFKYLKTINSTRRHPSSRRELSVPKILGSLPSYSRRKHPHATRKSYAFAAPTQVRGATCAYHNILAFCPPVRGANPVHAARTGDFRNPNLQKTTFYTFQTHPIHTSTNLGR